MKKFGPYIVLYRTRFFGVCALLFLAACTTPENPVVTPTPPDSNSEPSQGRTLTDWRIDPNFNVESLGDAETQAWYRRVELEVKAEQSRTCLPEGTTPEGYPLYPSSATIAACSMTKHYLGRTLNYHVTSLLTLFRVTGDAALLEEVDRVMEIVWSRLVDTDGDGYRNFRRIEAFNNTDYNTKEDTLAHAFISEVVYVFKKNAAASTPEHDYAAHADAWLEYLLNDFEAKWKQQPVTRRTEGLPQRNLMHPYMELLRYTVYMAQLIPEDARYTRLRDAMTAVAQANFKTDTTPNGDAFVWPHRVREAANFNDCLAFQMGTYPQSVMSTFMDLALEGYSWFSNDETTLKLSRTLSESLLDPNEKAFMYKDVGGLRNGSLNAANPKEIVIGGVCFKEAAPGNSVAEPEDNYRGKGSYRLLPWGFMAAFAADKDTQLENTEIYQINRDVYGDPFSSATPVVDVSVPAAMAFARLYQAGNYALR